MSDPLLPLPDASTLDELSRLYEAARFIDGWAIARQFRPVERWEGAGARVLAGRLLSNWGAPDLSDRVHWLTFRRHAEDIDALVFAVYSVRRRHGPYEALRLLETRSAAHAQSARVRSLARLHSLHGILLGEYRDFTRASEFHARAVALAPEDAWPYVSRAQTLEREDRYDDALASARHALTLRPWYRPGVEAAAHLLQISGREQDAVALLDGARAHVQSASISSALVRLLVELGEYRRAAEVVPEIAPMLPRLEPRYRDWLAAISADVAYHLHDWPAAVAAAQEARTGFQKRIVERLSPPPAEHRRVHLPITFVRQHHMTCAPATLAAIARYWGAAIDHAALATEITYDGTPDHVERNWAESNGWQVREFRVTWDATVALLDRGCPFTVTTVFTRSAHLQAMIGYDATLGSFIIRDPYERLHSESLADSFLHSYAPYGPRGMVFVPADRLGLLRDIELPDATLYDAYYRFHRALFAHDRDRAAAAQAELAALDPEHMLTLRSARELSSYDGTSEKSLELTERMLTRFPHEPNLLLDRLACLQRLGRTAERNTVLQGLTGRPKVDVLLLKEAAEAMLDDPRHLRRGVWMARRVLRGRQADAPAMRTLANGLWANGAYAHAESCYRLAATAADKDEDYWRSWFIATRHTHRIDECLVMLRARFVRYGAKSGLPVRTLFSALDDLDRTGEAFAALDDAILLRPDDGELLLFVARQRARFGQREAAERFLEHARADSRPLAWQRTAAFVAGCAMQHARALEHWQAILAADAYDQEAQSETTRLIALCQGTAAALTHLRAMIERLPHFLPLRVALAERLRREGAANQLPAIDEILAREPRHAWAWRERSIALRDLGRFNEALAAAEQALAIEPHAPSSHGLKGEALLALGRTTDAHAAFESGLREHIGADWLVPRLLAVCRTAEERRQALAFVRDEILRQPMWSDTVLELRTAARGNLDATEVRSWLEQLCRERPDQWQMHVALRAHFAENGDTLRALEIAQAGVERFEFIPRMWLELGDSLGRLDRIEEQIAALEHAVELSPGWTFAYQRLGIAHERELDLTKAVHAYQRGAAANPLDAPIRGHLADALWKLDRPEDAIAELTLAVQLDPRYSWGWRQLQHWHRLRGEPGATLAAARKAAEARAGDPDGWLNVANLLVEAERLEEALPCIQRAIAADGRSTQAHDQHAQVLTLLGRYEAAITACAPTDFGANPPFLLRGRRAWIEARRNNLQAAVSLMRDVLADAPDYSWGWERLSEWLADQKRFTEATTAAQHMVNLGPLAPDAWAQLAWCQIMQKETKAAKESLRHVLLLNPSHAWAADRLLEHLIDDAELADAEKLLETFRTHASRPTLQRATIQVALARRRDDDIRTALADLTRTHVAHTTQLEGAVRRLLGANKHALVEEILRPALSVADTNPATGMLWTRSWAGRRWAMHLRHLTHRQVPEEVRRAGFTEFIEEYGRRKKAYVLIGVVLRWRRWLNRHTDTWASVLYALTILNHPHLARRWSRDWRERADVLPWMLFNAATCRLRTHRTDTAEEILALAMRLTPDHTRPNLAALTALLAAQRGDIDRAAGCLSEVHAEDLLPIAQTARTCARALVAMARADPLGADDAWHEHFSTLIAERKRTKDPLGLRWCFTTLRRLARARRKWTVWLFTWDPSPAWFCATNRSYYRARALLIVIGAILFFAAVAQLGKR